MSLDADLIVDRRRMRRKLTFWRVATVLVALVAVVGAGLLLTGHRAAFTGGPGGSIARVTIEGLIRGDRQRVEALDRLAKSNAKAVIVHVNSPGGTVAGSEELYDSLRRVQAKRPATRPQRVPATARRVHDGNRGSAALPSASLRPPDG